MLPDQFFGSLKRQGLKPVYLFVGPEGYRRRQCREALLEAVLPPEERESGYVRHDLDELTLSEVLDDARSMSLFACKRLLWVGSAELAVPRGRGGASADDDAEGGKDAAGSLAEYCKDPTPGTVLVFDCQRYDFEGEDKAKLERLVKYYSAVKDVVEFARMDTGEAREFASQLASERGLRFETGALDSLVEATSGEPQRIAAEIEKLALFQSGGTVNRESVTALVPNASEATIFELVDALARRDRAVSLELLDRLVREGEYLPLALTFLAGIYRLALTAREQNLRTASEVQSFFQRQGVPMWRSKAEQISAAGAKFPKEKLEAGIDLVFQADRALKSNRPDDRIVMEDFVLKLTA
jgi:DNA polymerase-3 subunit delta